MEKLKPDKPQSPAERASAARPAFDGPHRRTKPAGPQKSDSATPPYVVAVTKREKTEDERATDKKSAYSPEELRMKARSLLNSNQLNSEEKKVLQEILGPEDT